ncbi:MAG: hypothetical protein WC326_08780 [Candidatus Delongbacteria bacterium]
MPQQIPGPHALFAAARGWLLALLLLGSLSAARATEVYSQPHTGTGAIHLSSWWDPDGSDYDQVVWDSFQLSADQAITEIRWRGGHDPAYAYWSSPVLDFTVSIWANNGTLWQPDVIHVPLAEYQAESTCGETPAGSFGGVALSDYHYTLPSPFQAAAGTRYWVQIIAWMHGIPDWGFATGSGGNGSHFRKLPEGQYQSITGDLVFSLHTSAAPTATIDASALPVDAGTVFGAGVYPLGSSATLTATPGPGFGFERWTENGAEISVNPQYTIQVSGDRSLVAHFVPACAVTLEGWPALGGQLAGAGSYNAGTPVTVTATPSLGYAFTGWLEWGATLVSTSPSYTFTATTDLLLVAQFEQLPLAATFDFDTGSPPCQPYQSMPALQTQNGLTVQFSAPTSSWSVQNTLWGYVPGVFSGNFLFPSGYFTNSLQLRFDHWLSDVSVAFCTGDYESVTDIPTQVRLRAYVDNTDNPPVAEAVVRGEWIILVYPEGIARLSSPVPFNLVVLDIPPGQGPNSTTIFYADNFIALRTAPPQVQLTTAAWPPEGGTASGAGSYDLGASAGLEALPAAGFTFGHWEDNGVNIGGGPLLDVFMDGDHALTAVFAPVLTVEYDSAVDPAVATLSWPWPCEGFVLRERGMQSGALWQDSTLPVEVVNGRNVVRPPVVDGAPRQVEFFLWHL